MNEDWDGEEVLEINDPDLPRELRGLERRFKYPAKYVVELGSGEYALYTKEGELLDLVWINHL